MNIQGSFLDLALRLSLMRNSDEHEHIPFELFSDTAINITMGSEEYDTLPLMVIDSGTGALISTLIKDWSYTVINYPLKGEPVATRIKLPNQFVLQIKFAGVGPGDTRFPEVIGIMHLDRTKIHELDVVQFDGRELVAERVCAGKYRSGPSGKYMVEMMMIFNRQVIGTEVNRVGKDVLLNWDNSDYVKSDAYYRSLPQPDTNLHSITQPAEPQPNPHDKPVQVEEKFVNTWIPQKDQYVYIDDSEELHVLVDFDAFENAFFVIPADSARNERLQNMAVPAKRNAAGSNPTSYSTVGARRTIKVKGSQITPYVLEF